ncbi:hypothetical protein V8F06_005818 [Rhypophila decipiens]
MDDYADRFDFDNFVVDVDAADFLAGIQNSEDFEVACAKGHIKTNRSPPPASYTTTYDEENSPQSSGSSRNSFDSSLARLTESPTSRKSSVTEGDMSAEATFSKEDWTSFQMMDTTGSPLFLNSTIDPSTIVNAQSSQQNGHLDHHDSPLDGNNLFATVTDESSPPTMDKDSPSSNVFNFGGDFQNYISSQPMETANGQHARPLSTPFGIQKTAPPPFPDFDFSGLPQVQPAVEGLWGPQPGGDMRLFHGGMPPNLAERHNLGIPLSAAPRLYGDGPRKLEILLDSSKRKSRVETQLMIKLILSPLPLGIKRLHIPHVTVGKPKLWAKPPAKPQADTLELHVSVVCTSAMQDPKLREAALERARASAMTGVPIPYDDSLDPLEQAKVGGKGGEVRICKNCVTREGKRAKRRKKVKSQEEDQLWVKDEWERILLFNTHEIKDWVEPNVEDMKKGIGGYYFDTPMRITCYCRHHHEKVGFQVIFTITDYQRNFIAQEMSPVVMITDDHKTNTSAPESPAAKSGEADLALQSQELSGLQNMQSPLNGSHASITDSQTLPQKSAVRNLSRSASPLEDIGPSTKRRKPSSHKIPANLQMTPVGAVSPTSANQMPPLDMNAVAATGFSPSAMQFSPSSFHVAFDNQISNPFGNAATNNQNNALQNLVNGSTNLENMGVPMYSAPASTHPSRAPSPNGLRTSASPMPMPITQPTGMHQNLLYNGMPIRTIQPPVEPVVIQKVIPGDGPKAGGIEVTVLGAGFTPGTRIMFGDVESSRTTLWSPNCAVCVVPPSPVAGMVMVTSKGQAPDPQRPPATFTYNNEDEVVLMRLALGILSSGGDEVMKKITRSIIETLGGAQAGGEMPNGPMFTAGGNQMNTESQILKVLEVIDMIASPQRNHLDRQSPSGHTMLHLASSMGLPRVVAGLLARGANPDVSDKGGYTPLHLASLNNYADIVRRLVRCGADPEIRTISGLLPRDVTRSQDVLRAIPTVSRATLPSSDLLHRRVRSATSLRSQWEPLVASAVAIQRMPSNDETTTDEDDDGSDDSSVDPYNDSSSDNSEDVEQSDQEHAGLELPRQRVRAAASRSASRLRKRVERAAEPDNPDPSRPPSPAAAVTAFKEQFAAQLQYIQQAMALHLQSLPQFPFQASLPQFPVMPSPLTDYQQRLLAMMPALGGGGRTETDAPPTGGKTTAAVVDRKWWDLSFKGSTTVETTLPPAYEELYPTTGSSPADTKQASAAAAAADAEADEKCAALFDNLEDSSGVLDGTTEIDGEEEEEEEEGESSTTFVAGALPEVLQIPRRSAITKEHRDTLRQAHAIKVTWLRRDWKLWFIWMPALVVIMGFMLYNSSSLGLGGVRWQEVKMVQQLQTQTPGVVDAARAVGKFVTDTVGEMTGAAAGTVGIPVGGNDINGGGNL